MKTVVKLTYILACLLLCSAVNAQQRQYITKNLDAYVGTWEYRTDTECFKIIFVKGLEDLEDAKSDCVIGGYQYQRNGAIVFNYLQSVPVRYTRLTDGSAKIIGTNASSYEIFINPNRIRIYFYDDGLKDRSMNGEFELLSPTQARWVLRHPQAEFNRGPAAEPGIYSVPTDVVMTKVQ